MQKQDTISKLSANPIKINNFKNSNWTKIFDALYYTNYEQLKHEDSLYLKNVN